MSNLPCRRMIVRLLVLVSVVLPLSACGSTPSVRRIPEPQVAAGRAAVASETRYATQIGMDILKQGGNSVDAAVAVAFALAVTWPEAGNIGGGGFMMIAGPAQKPVMIDYRETAPAAATANMFNIGESTHQCKAVGTPGTVRGLALAHQKYGELPWRDLVMPAVKLARHGIVVNDALAGSINRILAKSPDFAELQRVYARKDGQPWAAGNTLRQRDLADTLAAIAANPDNFYTGAIADQIVTEMNAADSGAGLISKQDLAAYEAKIRQPVHSVYRRYDVYGPNLPSSGGITVGLMLKMLERHDLKKLGRWSPQTSHLMIETMRRAFLERARHLGDSDFVTIPAHLTTAAHARKLADSIDTEKATPSATLAPDIEIAGEGDSTTHFSIIDKDGLAVSNTYTLENSWGARVVVRGGGFLLNNEMGDFNWKAGHTDTRGRIGTDANLIAPNKRMLSSMSPTIVMRDGRVFMVTGSPGGRTIINTTLEIILNVIEFDMDPAAAVRAPRLHHQWLPDQARFELSDDPDWADFVAALEAKGHAFMAPRLYGSAHTIVYDYPSEKYIAVADRRRDGQGGAAGK